MVFLTLFIIISVAALIHASFQASIATLLMLGAHLLSVRTATARMMRTIGAYLLGCLLLVFLLLAGVQLIVHTVLDLGTPTTLWYLISAACIIIGGVVLFFYYHKKTTRVRMPPTVATLLKKQARSTSHPMQALVLGMFATLADLPYTLILIIIIATATQLYPTDLQLATFVYYLLVALAPLIGVTIAIGGGTSIARLQKWREGNQRFIQVSSGIALIALGMLIFTSVSSPISTEALW